MKHRWWLIICLFAIFGSVVQFGCGPKTELPMEASPDVEEEEPGADVEIPPP